MRLLLAFALACILLLSTASALNCKSGELRVREDYHGEIIETCVVCGTGYYCPGDDNSYPCPEHSYSDERGQTECKPCDKPVPKKTACMLNDAPDDIRQLVDNSISYGSSEKYSVKSSAHFVFLEDAYFIKQFSRGYRPTLNVVQAAGQTGQITAYFSNTTGNPSESNHSFKTVNTNVTALIAALPARQNLMYVTLEFQRPCDINVGIYNYATAHHDVSVGVNKYVQSGGISLEVFTVRGVKSKSKVTLSISTGQTTRTDYLYWSSNKQIPYPNELNYQARVVNQRSLTVEDEGDVTFSFHTYLPGSMDGVVKVDVTPL
ncbi:hypothetical protein AKO1_000997 [Acrasis kona]|uniref:Tyrosine-protein kinase Wsck n=1 Tax=Acrasis kona TaxID=1008807 RepID=A0AAW2ZCK8_9EUKA